MPKKQLASKLLTIGFIVLFVWYGLTNKDIFSSLGQLSIITVVLVVVGKLTMYLLTGAFTKWTVEVFTEKMSVFEGLYLSILTALGNFFGPLLGGTSIRAVYLKKAHKLQYSKFTSTLMGYYLIFFIVNCSLALIALGLLPRGGKSHVLVTFFAIWLAVLLILTVLRLPKRSQLQRFESMKLMRFVIKTVYETEEGWHLIKKNSSLLIRLFALAFAVFITNVLIAKVEFGSINAPISLAGLALYATLLGVSMLVSFTPGAIGIRETIMLVAASVMGVSSSQILQVALIDRSINFALLGVLFLLTRHSKTKQLLTSSSDTPL